jgi:hypothetical protein
MNTTKMEIPVKTITAIDDKKIMGYIPADVLAMLGEQDGTGYHLAKDRRDIFFTRGVVQYQPNGKTVTVLID